MGSKWSGEEDKDWYKVVVSIIDSAATENRLVDISLSYWPNHAIPVGMVIKGRNQDDTWLDSNFYMLPDEAESLGTALIFYAKRLRGEI